MNSKYFISVLFLLLQVYHFSTAQQFESLKKKGHEALCVSYSPDGKLLASGGNDNQVVIWDREKTKELYSLVGHKAYVLAVAFSPDGRYVASGSMDQTIMVWSTQTGFLDKVFTGHLGGVTSLVFSTDSKYLISGSADKSVAIWDMGKNIKVKELKEHTDKVSSVIMSSDGLYLASAGFDGSIIIRNFKKMEIAKKITVKETIRVIAFSPDNIYITAGFDDKSLRTFEAEGKNMEPVFTFRGHKKLIYDVKYSPDGKYIASGSFDNTIRIWNTETGEKVRELSPLYNFLSLSFNPVGKDIATADLGADIKLWNVVTLNIKPSEFKPVINYSTSASFGSGNSGNDTSKPAIEIIQPVINNMEGVFVTTEKEISVKGYVKSSSGVYEFLVNNTEIPITGDNGFNYQTKLAFGNNLITIKTTDKNNNIAEKSITIQRQVPAKGVNDTMTRTGKDYALIIATDQYDNFRALSNPINDAETIGKELTENYNFNVELFKNPLRTDLYKAIRSYSKKQFHDDDQLIIFIAGHGEFDPVFSEGYIVTKDSKSNDEVKESLISHSNLRTIINNIPCKHILLVMDVCFGGTFDQSIAGNRGEYSDDKEKQLFIKKKLQHTTRKYLTSGGKEYVPDGTPGAHSPFARKVIEALRSWGGEDGILTFGELYSYVERAKPGPRTGEFGNNAPGSDFLFIKK